jgi:predicted nucleic acid-binding protein
MFSGLPDIIIAATAVWHGLIPLTQNTDEIGRLGIAAPGPFAALPSDA